MIETEIPYRMETPELVRLAMEGDLLGLGRATYKVVYATARRLPLERPPALQLARPFVSKEFHRLEEMTRREHQRKLQTLADLVSIDCFEAVRRALPWLSDLVRYENIFSLYEALASTYGGLPRATAGAATVAPTLDSLMRLRRLIKEDMKAHVKADRTKHFTLDHLKRLIVGSCLYEPRNSDILQVLREAQPDGAENSVFQNAVAELLFGRVAQTIGVLIKINPHSIRKKLFSKLSKLGLSPRQQSVLLGLFPLETASQDLIPCLRKIDRIAARLNLPLETSSRVHAYIESLVQHAERAWGLYSRLFLSGNELQALRSMYVPRPLLATKTDTVKTIVESHLVAETLEFYPTKDYLDLVRGKVSGDCVGVSLAEEQLRVPNFFNIRVFARREWIGNIYMLDLCRESGVILVDRIQIERKRLADYVDFFQNLKDVLKEMFSDVGYSQIIAPLTISNHQFLQESFNAYRRRLSKTRLTVSHPSAASFESLRRASKAYYVLAANREEPPVVHRSSGDYT